VKLSVIVATKNRARAVAPCLDSIATALAKAAPLDAEIIIVDNGSTDNTLPLIKEWADTNNTVSVQALSEPCAGKARALNRGPCGHPEANCWPSRTMINTRPTPMRWSRALNSARHEAINGKINGCNMTMRRALLDRVGLFDEDFGPGSCVGSGDDTEFMYRVYVAGTPIDYVPDMTVFHHHGRKTCADGFKLWQRYTLGNGAHVVKYFSKHPDLCRPFLWDIKNAVREIATGTNTFLPEIGFSHRHRVLYSLRGALRYFFTRKTGVPPA
jgi:GT2 family glycosyltransferase